MTRRTLGSDEGLPDVSGVRVLVTGGTSGLGLGMVRALIAGGASVALTGRHADRARLVAGQVAAAGPGPATGIGMDVRDETSVARGVAVAREALGGMASW